MPTSSTMSESGARVAFHSPRVDPKAMLSSVIEPAAATDAPFGAGAESTTWDDESGFPQAEARTRATAPKRTSLRWCILVPFIARQAAQQRAETGGRTPECAMRRLGVLGVRIGL